MAEVEEQTASALKTAVRLLAIRARSRHEIAERLKAKGFPEHVTDYVLKRLSELKFIDDREFARLWIESKARSRPVGRTKLRRELIAKGVPRDIIDGALEGIHSDEELDLARKALLKASPKATDSFASTLKESARLHNYLARRGFSGDVIRRVVRDAVGASVDLDC